MINYSQQQHRHHKHLTCQVVYSSQVNNANTLYDEANCSVPHKKDNEQYMVSQYGFF